MRRAYMITAAMVAIVGAGVMAKGYRGDVLRGAKAADFSPVDEAALPHDAYPDDLHIKIWEHA